MFQELDGLGIVARLLEQRGCGIEVLKRIAHHHNQAAQQLHSARRVAGGDADFSQAEKICGLKLVIVEFAGEDELQHLARRLFISGVGQLPRR